MADSDSGDAAASRSARNRRPIEALNDQHLRILELLARDADVATISAQMHTSTHTVKYHLARLREYFGVRTLTGLVAAAVVYGLLTTGQGSLEAISAIDLDGLGDVGLDLLR